MHSGLVRALVPVSLCLGLGLPAAVGHQQRDLVVVGRITESSQGRALANAQVLVQGTSISTMSDTGGRYRLSVPLSATKERELSLMARYIGYAPSTRTIRPATDSGITRLTAPLSTTPRIFSRRTSEAGMIPLSARTTSLTFVSSTSTENRPMNLSSAVTMSNPLYTL